MTLRDYFHPLAAGAAASATSVTARAAGGEADRAARMKWWHEARFGMFIHWGLYSVLGGHEWVMENEGTSSPNTSS
jgi:alpha-L-fucosidase